MLTALFAAEKPNGVHIAGDINEVYWGSAAFFVLVGLIWWKAGPAIKGMIKGRTERIRAELAEAESARSQAEAALNASTADLPDVSAEENRIRSEAVDTAAQLKVDLVAKAHSDADALKARAAADVENMKRQALADIQAEVADATRSATEALVSEQLDASSHTELIENYINQVGQSR